jgi:hypothetical protein
MVVCHRPFQRARFSAAALTSWQTPFFARNRTTMASAPTRGAPTPTPRRGTPRGKMEATGTTGTMTMSTPSPPCGMGSIERDGGTVFVLRRRWLRFE